MRTVYDYLGLRTTDIVGLGLGLDNHNSKCALLCALFDLNTKSVQQ